MVIPIRARPDVIATSSFFICLSLVFSIGLLVPCVYRLSICQYTVKPKAQVGHISRVCCPNLKSRRQAYSTRLRALKKMERFGRFSHCCARAPPTKMSGQEGALRELGNTPLTLPPSRLPGRGSAPTLPVGASTHTRQCGVEIA
jgi:hypothetical protein